MCVQSYVMGQIVSNSGYRGRLVSHSQAFCPHHVQCEPGATFQMKMSYWHKSLAWFTRKPRGSVVPEIPIGVCPPDILLPWPLLILNAHVTGQRPLQPAPASGSLPQMSQSHGVHRKWLWQHSWMRYILSVPSPHPRKFKVPQKPVLCLFL